MPMMIMVMVGVIVMLMHVMMKQWGGVVLKVMLMQMVLVNLMLVVRMILHLIFLTDHWTTLQDCLLLCASWI